MSHPPPGRTQRAARSSTRPSQGTADASPKSAGKRQAPSTSTGWYGVTLAPPGRATRGRASVTGHAHRTVHHSRRCRTTGRRVASFQITHAHLCAAGKAHKTRAVDAPGVPIVVPCHAGGSSCPSQKKAHVVLPPASWRRQGVETAKVIQMVPQERCQERTSEKVVEQTADVPASADAGRDR